MMTTETTKRETWMDRTDYASRLGAAQAIITGLLSGEREGIWRDMAREFLADLEARPSTSSAL